MAVNHRNLRPVSIAGLEFDTLVEEEKGMSATVPVYPVENGFVVSDAIINDPMTLHLTLFVSVAQVTWKGRGGHENGISHIDRVVKRLEEIWQNKDTVKIVTSDAIYTNMGLTSIAIKKSSELGYSREIDLEATKVLKTKRKKTKIPTYCLKSGDSKQKAGSASTSGTSAKSSSSSAPSASAGGGSSSSASSASSSGSSGGSGGSSSTSTRTQNTSNKTSWAAKGFGFGASSAGP